jgi:hypothetical protein
VKGKSPEEIGIKPETIREKVFVGENNRRIFASETRS